MTETELFVEQNAKAFKIPYRQVTGIEGILRQSLLPYLPVQGIQVPFAEMFGEAKRLESVAIAHRYSGEDNRGWKSLVLHGISSAHTQGAEHYGMDPNDPSIYRWTDIADLCPVTKKFLQNELAYKQYQRVRFMYLEPGGWIAPHRDTDSYSLGPLNIALNHPEGCHFYMENVGEVPFVPGAAMNLALVNRHAVINQSSETRIHMIVHGAANWEVWEGRWESSYRRFVSEHPAVRILGS